MNTDSDDKTVTLRMSKATLYAVFGLLAGLILGFGLGRASTAWFRGAPSTAAGPSAPEYATAEVAQVDTTGRPARGPADAPVTIVEFTDYECPFCGRYVRETYPAIMAEYGDRVRYVIRNLPLASIHPHALKAAEAAECAAKQGRFWEYHDTLFEKQAFGLDEVRLKVYAGQVDLDAERFAHCLDSGAMQETVSNDLTDAFRYRLGGTPTFFINGRKLEGAQPFPIFQSFIEAALEEAGER